ASLPELFDRCREAPEFWEKIKPAIGRRGEWLIRQNPFWRPLLAEPDPDAWMTGRTEERLTWLRFWRKKDPDFARENLIVTWHTESPEKRAQFLNLLRINLSLRDEPFLEDCLYDARKPVRLAAAELLALLPDSALSARMTARVKMYLKVKGGKIELDLPEELDETALRDGIQGKMKSYRAGLRAGYFGQMLAKVPPARLEEIYQSAPADLLRAFAKSDWGDLLIESVIQAVVMHKTERWIEALLDYWLQTEGAPLWKSDAATRLLEAMPAPLFNTMTIRAISKTEGLLSPGRLATQLLQTSPHEWSDELTLLVFRRFRAILEDGALLRWNDKPYRALLETLSYRANPALYDVLKSGWNIHAPGFVLLETDIEQALRTLVFRGKMIAELETG
ncbi:MAG: hypothetical protein D6714_21255, partial [Bacteroidetes bacterium]